MTLIAAAFFFLVMGGLYIPIFRPKWVQDRRPILSGVLWVVHTIILCSWILCGWTASKIIFMPDEALWSFASSNEPVHAKIALLRGADPNVSHNKVGSPLVAAVSKNHVEMVRLLLENGGRADAPAGVWGDDSLAGYAAYLNYPGMLELLLSHGANPNRGGAGYQPLVMAADRGNVECVAILLAHRANTEVSNQMGFTPLEATLRFQNPHRKEIADMLLAAGAKRPSVEAR